ncbi:MAG: glutathione S-transferase family protein [Rhodothalassiaceae bacterium]
MQLYGHALSPFHMRVELLLALKDRSDAVARPELPGPPGSDAYKAINPIGKIPCLVVDGAILPESRAILTYLERLWPQPALVPAEAKAAADVELVCQLVDAYITPALDRLFDLSGQGVREGEAAEAACARLATALDHFEHFIAPGQHLVGDAWSLADCVAAPSFFFVRTMARRFKFDPFQDRPKTMAWQSLHLATEIGAKGEAMQQGAFDAYRAAKKRESVA